MEKIYGVVLVGCGYIGEEHLADIYFRDNVRVVSVVDLDLERAKLMARKYGAQEYGADYRVYLERVDVGIVITDGCPFEVSTTVEMVLIDGKMVE